MCEWPCNEVSHNFTAVVGPEMLGPSGVRLDVVDITLAFNLSVIQPFAFSGWSGLERVTLPPTVTEIMSYAFYNCKRLLSFRVVRSIVGLGDFSFANCGQLSEVTFEENSALARIGRSAFENCEKLAFELPVAASTLEIGPSAFYNMKCCRETDCLLRPGCTELLTTPMIGDQHETGAQLEYLWLLVVGVLFGAAFVVYRKRLSQLPVQTAPFDNKEKHGFDDSLYYSEADAVRTADYRMADAYGVQMSGLYDSASGDLELDGSRFPAYDWGDSMYEGGGVVTYESVESEQAPPSLEPLYSVVDRGNRQASADGSFTKTGAPSSEPPYCYGTSDDGNDAASGGVGVYTFGDGQSDVYDSRTLDNNQPPAVYEEPRSEKVNVDGYLEI